MVREPGQPEHRELGASGPRWRVITGDCLQILPTLAAGIVHAIVSDPPWGRSVGDGKAGTLAVTNSRRFSGGVYGSQRYGGNGEGGMGREWDPIIGDDKPFDPAPWLEYPKVVLFGSNHFGQRLPVGTTLVWIKKSDDLFGTFLSDAEVAWMKGGHGVYCFRKQFPPPSRMVEAGGECAHPTQKPIELMAWCLERAGIPVGATVLDPYCGSGTTGVACIQTGRNFIGIEIDEKYAEIARRRCREAEESFALFEAPRGEMTQAEMFGGAA